MKVADGLEIMNLLNRIRDYDSSLFAHSLHVCELSMRIAEHMNLDRTTCEELYIAALLHDYGKIYYPKIFLFKQGRFTDKERTLVQMHVDFGVQRLQECGCISQKVIEGIRQHHECLDGTGYPVGTKDLGVLGRIIGVADIYDALTQRRCYKGAYPVALSIQMLKDNGGKKYDDKVVNALECVLAEGLDYSDIDKFISSDSDNSRPNYSACPSKIQHSE